MCSPKRVHTEMFRRRYDMYSLLQHEKKQHGTPDFPAEYHYIDYSHPRYHMSFHWHKEWELIRIMKGSFSLHVDDAFFSLKAGDVILVRGGMLHGGTPEDCVYECFLFDLHGLFKNYELIKKYLRPFYRLEKLPQLLYTPQNEPEVCALAGELMSSHEESLHELITVTSISRLFTLILQNQLYTQNPSQSVGKADRIGQIKAVLEYMEQNYRSSITLEELASVAGMNPRYFCGIFKKITHQTPMDYVAMYRIDHAANLLADTDLSITAISFECGFNECSYFIRTFKKYKHITPYQYRKMNHAGSDTSGWTAYT